MKKASYYLALILWLLPAKILAATLPGVDNQYVGQKIFPKSPTSDGAVNDVANQLWTRITTIFFSILGGLAILLLIWAGIQYATANGSQEKTKKARQAIFQIVLGIVIMGATYAIISTVLSLLNRAATNSIR